MGLGTYDYLNLAAESLIGIVSVCGNGLVLYVIYRNKTLQTFTNYLIASLATADLLVGFLGVPSVIINYVGLPRNFNGCLFTICMIVIATDISIFSLLAIGIERFLAIKYPLRHRRWMNGETAVAMIVVVWVAGIVVGLVPMFGWHLGKPSNMSDFDCAFVAIIDMNYMVYFNFLGFVLTPLVILFLTYGYIFSVVHKRAKSISVAHLEGFSRTSTFSNVAKTLSQSQQLKKDSKAAKLIFLVLVMFAVCWLPIHIMNSLTLWLEKTNVSAVIIGILLSHANSCVNPFVYALSNVRFRKAFMEALRIRPNRVSPVHNVVKASGSGQANKKNKQAHDQDAKR